MSTVSQASTQATNTIAEVQAGDAHQDRDFLLFCPAASNDSEVMNAIHALYYLPAQYKLVVMKHASIVDGRKLAKGNEPITDRILFETDTRAPGETPSFSYASAVIYSDDDSRYAHVDAPHIVISEAINDAIERRNGNGYVVPADNPEALASAAMRIASDRYATA